MRGVENKIVYNIISENSIEFEKKVKRLAVLGVTSIVISQIEKNRWVWEKDMSDPYPNWGMLITSLFKIIVPDKLKKYLPIDYAERNFNLIKKRYEILKKYNLKGALIIGEPFYLPEKVYRDHPDWRGPRCDHPRRARNYYYSPCIDNEEVLAMYKEAMFKFCKAVDIDYLKIITNDSGAGICWSTGLYSGDNGPESCKHRLQSDRIVGFLSTLQSGAKDAGVNIDIEINSNIGIKEKEDTMDIIWPFLKKRQAVNGKKNNGKPMSVEVNMNYDYLLFPIKNLVTPISFMEKLEDAFKSDINIINIKIDDCDFDEYYKLIEEFLKNHTLGLLERINIIRKIANDICGEKNGNSLTEAWNKIEKGIINFIDTGIEGIVSCCVSQRWINRPFVLFPQELLVNEKDYYRKFQFQANDEKHADDLLDIQCTSFIRGYSGVFLASMSLNRAIINFEEAIFYINHIIKNTTNNNKKIKFRFHRDRIKLLICFMKNILNAIKFQNIIDNTNYEVQAKISCEWPIDAEPNLLLFENITRAEIDNTNEIIRLIKGREHKMLSIAATDELEDIFLFSPNLVEQLKKKTHIMLDHMLEDKRLYITNNK